MRLVLQCIGVIVIAGDGAIGLKRAAFEYGFAGVVSHRDVKPRAPRRVTGGEFVAAQVLHIHGCF